MILAKHVGHNVVVVAFGHGFEGPDGYSLQCEDCIEHIYLERRPPVGQDAATLQFIQQVSTPAPEGQCKGKCGRPKPDGKVLCADCLKSVGAMMTKEFASRSTP